MSATTSSTRTASRYLGDSLSTASPAALLVMLYDRLLLDLQRAEAAQLEQDRQVAHDNLMHAQAIVAELQVSLDVAAWEGGANLVSLYTWLLQELATANATGDAARTAACREHVAELADAWRQAALEHLTGGAATGHGIA